MKREEGAAILIVDNDPELAKVLALRLSHAGHFCVTANSAAQALSEWQQRSFDIVVSDLNMPGGDGIALAEALQRSEIVPIIFITGFREDFKRRLRRTEDVTVLEKPFDPQKLIELIDATLVGREAGGGKGGGKDGGKGSSSRRGGGAK